MSDPHSRFWATLDPLRCACPTCGCLIAVPDHGRHAKTGPQASRGLGPRGRRHAWYGVWDHERQLLKCPKCGTKYQAGLLLWPLPIGRHPRRVPPDVKPTRRELAELRNLYAGGWWMNEPSMPDTPVNRYEPEGCTCAPLPWRADCPLHGGERTTNGEDT